jgi:acyl carrier protein
MLSKESIQTIVLKALSDINEERASDELLNIDLNTRLFGVDAVLDSLSLVSVIVDVETAVSERVGREICLTDDRAMSQETSPFSDVNTLSAYVELLLSEMA